jgi:hypothetical protein
MIAPALWRFEEVALASAAYRFPHFPGSPFVAAAFKKKYALARYSARKRTARSIISFKTSI